MVVVAFATIESWGHVLIIVHKKKEVADHYQLAINFSEGQWTMDMMIDAHQ